MNFILHDFACLPTLFTGRSDFRCLRELSVEDLWNQSAGTLDTGEKEATHIMRPQSEDGNISILAFRESFEE